jgi:ABC-type dipeptide/oligopeptide/nickel transport system permease subunit
MRGGAIVLFGLLVALSLFAPFVAPYDPAEQNLQLGLSTPTPAHILGTDQLGRDLLSRILHAGRTSLSITLLVLSIALVIGAVVGLAAGYVGGMVDEACMRVVDLFMSLPTFILTLALVGTLGAGIPNLVIALAVGWWPPYARLVRSAVLAARSSEYVLAAECLGFTPAYIMRRYLLPAPLSVVAVQLSLDVGQVMLAVAGLGFLGLGIAPPQPEWGTMLVDARPFLQSAPHLVLAPGFAVFCAVFGCHALSEVLERWLNPQR